MRRGMTMTDSNGHGQSSDQASGNPTRSIWPRIWGFDSWVHSAASLSIVTVIAGWFGTYIQYLNAYEQKVGATAQADMAAATATFLEISNAYAEAQTEQQLIYFNFRDASKQEAPAGDQEMATKAAQTVHPDYVKARQALRQSSNGYFRKAELYIDWASNLQRDAADTKAIDGDPLNASTLGVYDFDCEARANFPHYAYKGSRADVTADDEKIEQGLCADPNQKQRQISYKSDIVLCIYDKQKKAIDHSKPGLIINWHCAKHTICW